MRAWLFRSVFLVCGLFCLSLLACGGQLADRFCSGTTPGTCPAGAVCTKVNLVGTGQSQFVCVQLSERSGLGGVCEGDPGRCQPDLFCLAPGGRVPESYCTKTCQTNGDCPAGYTCESLGQSQACQRKESNEKTPTEGCRCKRDGGSCTEHGHDDCAVDDGYFCLSNGPKDPNAICIKSCDPKEEKPCADGFFCAEHASGQSLCVKEQYTRKALGGNCEKGGKAECLSGLFCFTRYTSDPDAFCTQRCNPYDTETGCPLDYACEAPGYDDPFVCIPRGTKTVGEDCSREGYRGCFSAYCLQPDRNSSDAFCSERCDPSNDQCPRGYTCQLFSNLYRYLCAKAQGGQIGSLCNKNGNADCASGVCIDPPAGGINKVCSQACSLQMLPCPQGWRCDLGVCQPDQGSGKIGDTCTQTSDCLLGNCITNAAGKSFCTQVCQQDTQCPTDYTCQSYGTTRFCLPKPNQQGQAGDPCPNGASDCVSQICISDPLKGRTFCSQTCDDQQPCPGNLKCHPVSPSASFCTPQDYVSP